MSQYDKSPWLAHFIYKLLQNKQGALGLLAHNPFPQRAPAYIQADLYEYEFTTFADKSDAWWKRKRLGTWLGPLTAEDPELLKFLAYYGWKP